MIGDANATQMQLDAILNDYVSVTEFAENHGMTPGSVRALIERGQIEDVVKIGGPKGIWYVHRYAEIEYKRKRKPYIL